MKGIVVKSTGSWYTVQTKEREKIACKFKGSFKIKNIKSTNPIAVGDEVEFDVPGGDETGLITNILPRKNYIIRKSINLSKQTHIIASNIDQAFLVVTYAKPRTSTGFMDRFLVSAEAYHIPTIIVFNKIDLLTEDQSEEQHKIVQLYQKIGYQCLVVSAVEKTNIHELPALMKDKVSLLCGHSGTGKSTLINSIDKNIDLKTGEISSAHDKGKHTTTFAEMYELSSGGFIVDTPGIKELGVVEIEKSELSGYFPEMYKLSGECQFSDCTHVNEPKCAIKKAVESGEIAISRYHSYLSILQNE